MSQQTHPLWATDRLQQVQLEPRQRQLRRIGVDQMQQTHTRSRRQGSGGTPTGGRQRDAQRPTPRPVLPRRKPHVLQRVLTDLSKCHRQMVRLRQQFQPRRRHLRNDEFLNLRNDEFLNLRNNGFLNLNSC
ncbi:hypothetical protein [Mycobacterium marinum]|uniref:hypothetical protein n=1 Tax=Mycobacterium marinum TaxID=1781 RepID=UPI003BB0DD82